MLSSPGIGSGLDVHSIIGQLMRVEQRPLAALATREAKQQAQLSAYGSLKGALSSLQSSAQALAKSTTFTGFRASLADGSLASVSAAAGAAAGRHEIEVLTLAQSQKIASAPFETSATALGSGTLTLTFGSYEDDGTFTANPAEAVRTISIGAEQSSVAGVRDAINAADAGVTASLVHDGSGYRLVIAADETGLSHAMRITVSDDDGNHTDNDGLSQLAYDASTGGTAHLTETVAARNATLTIDGIAISKAANTISDALEGVTLTLRKADPGNPTSLTIARDSASAQAAVEAFIKGFNELHQTLRNLSNYDATNQRASVLTGDSTLRAVQTQMRRLLGSEFPAEHGGFSLLTQIGIGFQKDGSLALDSSRFSASLAEAPEAVTALLTEQFAPGLNRLIDGMLQSDGLINSRMDGIQASIKTLDKQREVIGRRLEDTEKRLRAQFAALDTMLASMSQTSNFLQQQLANLPKIGDK